MVRIYILLLLVLLKAQVFSLQLVPENGVKKIFTSFSRVPANAPLRTAPLTVIGEETRMTPLVYGNLTLEPFRKFSVTNPAYVQILRKGVLSVTSFSLLKRGSVVEFELYNQSELATVTGERQPTQKVNDDSRIPINISFPDRELNSEYYKWPNELTVFKDRKGEEVMIVPDGFLTPGQSNGGLYLVRNPSDPKSRAHRITSSRDDWFYHRAVHLRMPGGKEGILTARARKVAGEKGNGELVWICLPDDDHYAVERASCIPNPDWGDEFDDRGGALFDSLPEFVLAEGPDVMFEVWDMDPMDETLEVVTVNFFDECISLYTLRAINTRPYIEVVDTINLDSVGRPYGICLANMNPQRSIQSEKELDNIVEKTKMGLHTNACTDHTKITSPSSPYAPQDHSLCDNTKPTHILISTHECSYDVGSGISMVSDLLKGKFPMIRRGRDAQDAKRQAVQSGAFASESGGALFAFEIPKSRKDFRHAEAWRRYTLFRGFKVRGFGGIVSPGAPGLPYVFRLPEHYLCPPLILLAGDCKFICIIRRRDNRSYVYLHIYMHVRINT